jgi:hypothetical protein
MSCVEYIVAVVGVTDVGGLNVQQRSSFIFFHY